jgi:uncharacterized lipoprotein YajG
MADQLQLTKEQDEANVFAFSAQQEARAALAHVRLVQELSDCKAQGAVLSLEASDEVRGLLEDVSPKATKSVRGTKS